MKLLLIGNYWWSIESGTLGLYFKSEHFCNILILFILFEHTSRWNNFSWLFHMDIICSLSAPNTKSLFKGEFLAELPITIPPRLPHSHVPSSCSSYTNDLPLFFSFRSSARWNHPSIIFIKLYTSTENTIWRISLLSRNLVGHQSQCKLTGMYASFLKGQGHQCIFP